MKFDLSDWSLDETEKLWKLLQNARDESVEQLVVEIEEEWQERGTPPVEPQKPRPFFQKMSNLRSALDVGGTVTPKFEGVVMYESHVQEFPGKPRVEILRDTLAAIMRLNRAPKYLLDAFKGCLEYDKEASKGMDKKIHANRSRVVVDEIKSRAKAKRRTINSAEGQALQAAAKAELSARDKELAGLTKINPVASFLATATQESINAELVYGSDERRAEIQQEYKRCHGVEREIVWPVNAKGVPLVVCRACRMTFGPEYIFKEENLPLRCLRNGSAKPHCPLLAAAALDKQTVVENWNLYNEALTFLSCNRKHPFELTEALIQDIQACLDTGDTDSAKDVLRAQETREPDEIS